MRGVGKEVLCKSSDVLRVADFGSFWRNGIIKAFHLCCMNGYLYCDTRFLFFFLLVFMLAEFLLPAPD